MKAFSFIRSSLAGGCYQGPPGKPEESLPSSGFIPKVPSLLFDLEVGANASSLSSISQNISVPVHGTRLILSKPWLLQLEDGSAGLVEKQEDMGAPAIAAHIRSLTEPRSEEECQVDMC